MRSGNKMSVLERIKAPFTLKKELSFEVAKLDFVRLLYKHVPPASESENRSKYALETSMGFYWEGSTKKDIDIGLNSQISGAAQINLEIDGDESSTTIFMRVYPAFGFLFFLIFIFFFFGVFLVVGFLAKLPSMVAGGFAVLTPMAVLVIVSARKSMNMARENLAKEIYNVVSKL